MEPKKGRVRLALCAAVLAVVVTSCTWLVNEDYAIDPHFPPSFSVVIRQSNTNLLESYRKLAEANATEIQLDLFNGRFYCLAWGDFSVSITCTQAMMHAEIRTGHAFWYNSTNTANLDEREDFQVAFRSARLNTNGQRCLTITVSSQFASTGNWTWRNWDEAACHA
jgi:hypothetical protein